MSAPIAHQRGCGSGREVRVSDAAVERLYRAIAGNDPASAIGSIEEAMADGVPHARLFEDVYVPALARLGAAWAQGEVDEFQFTEAAVVAEQVTSFVTPPAAAPDRGVTVVLGCMRGDLHDLRKNIFAAALKTAGYRVLDLGVDTTTGEFLAGVDETGARIAIVFAEEAAAAASVGQVREAFDAGGRSDTLVLVAGGPFEADPAAARASGANGVANTAQGILRLVERVVADRLGGGA
jgi:5-methyltetrahydrofolate--homocysteine methyltransferase